MNLVITNGLIVDGTGAPAFKSDVWIDDGKIAKVGKDTSLKAERAIDAEGMIVTPGFTDMHTHSDFCLFWNRQMERKVRQGVTTEVIGNCGVSAAPLTKDAMTDLKAFLKSWVFSYDKLDLNWETQGGYFDVLEKEGLGINIASLVGHTTVRLNVLGFDNRAPTPAEMQRMKDLVEQSMSQGAFGLSTGLDQTAPGNYATTEEIAELCKVVARLGGIHASHMRGYSPDEIIKVAELSGVKSHIAHYGMMDNQSEKKLDEVAKRGIAITLDVYPYTAGMDTFTSILPESLQGGGPGEITKRVASPDVREAVKKRDPSITWLIRDQIVWKDVIVAYCEKNKSYQGKTIEEIAKIRKVDPIDALFDLYIEERGKAMIITFDPPGSGKTYETIVNALRHPRSTVGSDSVEWPVDRHPRSYGTHARVLSRYVRDMKVLPLEEAVRKMAYLPAQILGIGDRGLIREGMWADIAVSDLKEINDKCTYEHPEAYATGVRNVLINGELVLDDGLMTNALPGKVLRFRSS